jgi:MoaA/NifB/PqqE/SkfB family radical SAM enzyme
MLGPEAPVDPGIADLLEPGPIKRVRIDFTTACNLRCVYCAVSGANYAAAEMSAEVVNRVIANISAVQRHNALATIMVNGHGETTSIDNWPRLIEPLLQTGIPVAMQSNFAKSFSADELSTLSRMSYIVVSIDSADRQALMKIRRILAGRRRSFILRPVSTTKTRSISEKWFGWALRSM